MRREGKSLKKEGNSVRGNVAGGNRQRHKCLRKDCRALVSQQASDALQPRRGGA